MRLVCNSYECASGVDKFASSAIIQKQTDDPGKKALLKNVGYNALRWISVLTIVPMAVAAVKKHARKSEGNDSIAISLEVNEELKTFEQADFFGKADVSAYYGKYCLLDVEVVQLLQNQNEHKAISQMHCIIDDRGESFYLARLESKKDNMGSFKLIDRSGGSIKNSYYVRQENAEKFVFSMELVRLIES